MAIDSKAEEVVEILWRKIKEEAIDPVPCKDIDIEKKDSVIQNLLRFDLISLKEEKIGLTEKGMHEAASMVRRHRLAERLMADVLDFRGILFEETACKLEHLLHKELEEKICTLLGHPKTCPHGNPIPPGPCCLGGRETDIKLVTSLTDLQEGQKGNIAYLHTDDSLRLQKLISMGIIPGIRIILIRRYPSFVFKAGYSQFAVDKDMAEGIYIRLEEPDSPPHRGRTRQAFRHKHRRSRPSDT